jgi:hypothetical protein
MAVIWVALQLSIGIGCSCRSGESFSGISFKLQLTPPTPVDLVLTCGQEKLSLSGLCDSCLDPRGISALRFWEPNTSSLSKCGSQVQNSFALGIFAIAAFNALGILDRCAQGCHTRRLEAFWRAYQAGRRAGGRPALSITPNLKCQNFN